MATDLTSSPVYAFVCARNEYSPEDIAIIPTVYSIAFKIKLRKDKRVMRSAQALRITEFREETSKMDDDVDQQGDRDRHTVDTTRRGFSHAYYLSADIFF
jgi:hypothetical protein